MFTLKGNYINNSYDKDVYYELKEHKYFIIYRYDIEKETIIYEAVYKNRNIEDKYIKAMVYADGKVEKAEPFYCSERTNSLLKYIQERDRSLSEEELNEIYKPIEKRIKPLLSLNEKEVETRNDQRKKFTYFLKNLQEKSEILNSNDLAELKLIFIRKYNGVKVSLKVGKTKFYKCSSIKKFLDNVNHDVCVTYGKCLTLNHSLASFDEKARKTIEILMKYYKDYDNSDFYYLKINDFITLLKIHTGEYVTLFDEIEEDYLIEGEVEASINVNDEGDIELIPHISDGMFYGCEGVSFDHQNKKITYITFKNELIYETFKFMYENDNIELNSIKDLFEEKFLPLMSNEIEISDQYKTNRLLNLYKIKLMVDITDDDELVFKTLYLKNEQEISRNMALHDFEFSNKVNDYDLVLSNLQIPNEGIVSDSKLVINFLTSDLETLKKYADVMLSEKILSMRVVKKVKYNINASYLDNWLELNVSSNELTEQEIAIVLAYYKKKKKFVRLKDRFIIFDEREIEELNELYNDFNLSEQKEDKKIPLYEIFKISSYKDNFDINYDTRIKDILNDIINFKTSEFAPNAIFSEVLRPYQKDAFRWMSVLNKYNLSGILADDMGLGKTLEMISFITSIKEEKPILIVSPKSLLYNWENEITKWNKELKCVIVNGLKDDRKRLISRIDVNKKIVYVTSYDALRNDVDEYKDINFSLMVLDEAQYIKNVMALKTKAVKEISANTRFVLTGTPIENSLMDLWSIFDFLMPNYLLRNDQFKKQYESAIFSGDVETLNRLKAKITPFILRRNKSDVLKDLPLKEETTYIIDMKESQRLLYDAYFLNFKNKVQENSKNKIEILSLLTRLRQICVDPSMFVNNYEDVSEKLQATIGLIKEAIVSDHKVLVFSSFTQSLEHLRKLLDEEDINSFYIHGGVDAKKRLDICNQFNTLDDTRVTLISLKAGGTGLNLVGADIVIHLDPWWNVAAEEQASDRAHRIGQTRNVNVIKMVCKNSIEEKVIKLQQIKKGLSSSIINENDQSITNMTDEDIEYLLS